MISVVVPTLNAEAGLAASLTSLVPAAVEGLVREVIVVDGGSTDGTAAAATIRTEGLVLFARSGSAVSGRFGPHSTSPIPLADRSLR